MTHQQNSAVWGGRGPKQTQVHLLQRAADPVLAASTWHASFLHTNSCQADAPGTTAHVAIAEQAIHHGGPMLSRLELPVIPSA